jgi:hypothetical protein
MFDPHGGKEQRTRTDPFMGIVLGAVVTLGMAVVARSAGLSWKGLGHWTGELLLIIGIALAAQGISDVRREWTSRPGIMGRAKQIAQAWRARTASFLWARWNRVVSWGWLAKPLHLRPHGKTVYGSAALSAGSGMSVAATGQVGWGAAPADGSIEERLAWLEDRMAKAAEQISTLNTRHEQEVRDIKASMAGERTARVADVQRIQGRMADLAGGGLKLQAWGVVCLLAGTLMTAVW